jgi:hypothetical protein
VYRFDAWRRFPAGAPELAAEVRDRDARLRAHIDRFKTEQQET